MKKQEPKYDKRRAVSCKIIKKSESNPGYCKYLVTIIEKDGTVHKEPAYGRDMQDAISRLIWKERTHKVERNLIDDAVSAINKQMNNMKNNRNSIVIGLIMVVCLASCIIKQAPQDYIPMYEDRNHSTEIYYWSNNGLGNSPYWGYYTGFYYYGIPHYYP